MFEVRAAQGGLRAAGGSWARRVPGEQAYQESKRRLEDFGCTEANHPGAGGGQADIRRSSSRDPYNVSNESKGSSSSWGRVTIPLRAVLQRRSTIPPAGRQKEPPGQTKLKEPYQGRVCCTNGASSTGMIQVRSCKASSPTWPLSARHC